MEAYASICDLNRCRRPPFAMAEFSQFFFRCPSVFADLPEKERYQVSLSAEGEISSMSAPLRLVRPRHENRSVPVRPPDEQTAGSRPAGE